MAKLPNITVHTMSMPHTREALAITEALMFAYDNPGQNVVLVTEIREHGRHLIQALQRAAVFMNDLEVKAHREVIEIHRMEGWEPSFVHVTSTNDPSWFAGRRPTRIYLCGPLGEFMYWATGTDADIHYVA